ncbi:hypothetical protein FDP41_003426 [Naegleria fowleri]|uniref:CHCH domain-containing protein n=1 Tax=Naegleria fowleri TaxID=5763 RepID=A0A6A5BT84_NAEFO|nr:uncharacterized protein FDP41_003426 [Naegleria fowleri]KAF0977434.1 hypothetical protein FDP41_003426 [Naegleria fowleri]
MGNSAVTREKQSDDPCHKLACKIQTCLTNNNFNQNKCDEEMKAYNDCVKKFAEKKKQEQLQSQYEK